MISLVNKNIETIEEKKIIAARLNEWGILADMDTGYISYIDSSHPSVKCKRLFLIRHAETEAVKAKQFMSDISDNSRLTAEGIDVVKESLGFANSSQFDVVLYGPIKRVIDTKEVVEQLLTSVPFVLCSKLKGIDNQGWEGKTFEELQDDVVFIAREINHNIFAKTEEGSSWGNVLCNCAEVIDYINLHYKGKNVLLVSQGSILRGIEILLHKRETPWANYTASGMYNLSRSDRKTNYGKISVII